jgi:hypothetical protein
MACQRCNSPRVAKFYAKCNELFDIEIGEHEYDGNIPSDLGLGDDGDYVRMKYCLECGQIQGQFPLPPSHLETTGEGYPPEEDIDVGDEDEDDY